MEGVVIDILKVDRMMEACKKLYGTMASSSLWEVIKTEPVIMEFLNSLQELEKEINIAKEQPQG